ncbi:hypothetical protein Taro_021319, partial [Colocasia esculenta]|nr:hypothetical protein [Colocasia esculenta]
LPLPMAAHPDVRGVLQFLRQNGFDRAASALQEDVLVRAGGSGTALGSIVDSAARAAAQEGEAAVPPWLPPVRVGVGQRGDDGGDGGGRSGSGSSASSSSDAFVSMDSSPSGLTNPYGLWPPYPADSEDSSDRLSQFGTARDYDDPNLFSDTFWEDPYLMKEASGEFTNEDKFIMTIDAEERFIVPKDLHLAPETSPKIRVNSCFEMCPCSVSRYDFREGTRECHSRECAEQVEVLNTSLLIIPLPVSSCAESFNTVDEKQCEAMEHVESHILEKELDMLSSFTFPSCDPPCDLKSRSSSLNAKENSTMNKYDKDFENVYVSDLVDERVSQPNGKDAVGKYGKSDRESHNHEYVGGEEAHNINDELQLRDFHEDEYEEHLFIVCELLRANLYEFQKFNEDSGGEVYFTLARIQKIAQQCLEALEYLHHLGVMHCDLKPENILIKSYSRCEIKIIDLGSSCFRTDSLCLYVQSRSYRAPEVILGLPYDEKIDIWSLGCILAELFTGDVLFPNDDLVLLLARMIGMLGPVDMDMLERGQETHKYFTEDYDLFHRNEETDQVEYIIPEKSSLSRHLKCSDAAFVEFLMYLLQMNPQRRPTAKQALQHPWFSCLYK